MDIFDEVDDILQRTQLTQENQKLKESIEAYRRALETQQKLVDALGMQLVVIANIAFPGAALDAHSTAFLQWCQEQVPDVKTCTARLAAIFDQVSAAKEEVQALEKGD